MMRTVMCLTDRVPHGSGGFRCGRRAGRLVGRGELWHHVAVSTRQVVIGFTIAGGR
jgi:hypothetical protein